MPVLMHKGIPYGEGTNTLDGLKDVDISNPSTGDVLKYDSSIGKFVNGVGGSAETEISGTLPAGASTVTLQNAAITTNSKIDWYVPEEYYGIIAPKTFVTDETNHTLTLTFDAQQVDVDIKVVIK
jgi:hypothetical protein